MESSGATRSEGLVGVGKREVLALARCEDDGHHMNICMVDVLLRRKVQDVEARVLTDRMPHWNCLAIYLRICWSHKKTTRQDKDCGTAGFEK